jgi:death-on-curing family protein
MIRLTKEQIIILHKHLIEETGGTDGLRDEGLLDSALNAPFQGYGTIDAFPSLQQKAARLGYGLIQNHAFIDGNKRIGTHAMLVFLALNGIDLEYTQDELSEMVFGVASGKISFENMLNWIISHQI